MVVYGVYFKENRANDPGAGVDEGLLWKEGLFHASADALKRIETLKAEDVVDREKHIAHMTEHYDEKDSFGMSFDEYFDYMYGWKWDIDYTVVGVPIN